MSFDLARFAEECGVEDPGRFAERCGLLRKFLEERNRCVNLTRLTAEDDFRIKHAADSLSIARFFPELATGQFTVADIGCGAGFPSLILALAFPRLEIWAIDSVGKKIDFVRQAAEKCSLANLHAVHGRSSELNCREEFQGKFDIVTARAVAVSAKICREASRFPSRRGRFIFYKTPKQAEEEKEALAAIKNVSWKNTEVFRLPGDAGERLFTVGTPLRHHAG